MMSAKNLD
ncbi:hypothetical protein BpHYR1_033246 [Brachionus plicatilis]|uniref:Uncharacterized protein n=1 Tax=Brachionus plicatilis TaxID=10195 RepID=A0A3M7Q0Y5_BRAPC|nr:hypothetical protein BpHYR1_033246 [Brachionus plicatilis]